MNNYDWIFCHRGWWKNKFIQNSLNAVNFAIDSGCSVEIDIRDHLNTIVVSHDYPEKEALDFSAIVSLKGRFALNLKSDGLILELNKVLAWIKSSQSFVFDGCIPEMLKMKNGYIPHALRLSEYEENLPWRPDYVWLDSFKTDWWIERPEVRKVFEQYKTVVVSPELHGRDPRYAWDVIFEERKKGNENIMICTDLPQEIMRDYQNEF